MRRLWNLIVTLFTGRDDDGELMVSGRGFTADCCPDIYAEKRAKCVKYLKARKRHLLSGFTPTPSTTPLDFSKYKEKELKLVNRR